MWLGTALRWLSKELSNGRMFCGSSPAFVMANRRHGERDSAFPQGADAPRQLPNPSPPQP